MSSEDGFQLLISETMPKSVGYLGIPDDADQCSGACRSPVPG